MIPNIKGQPNRLTLISSLYIPYWLPPIYRKWIKISFVLLYTLSNTPVWYVSGYNLYCRLMCIYVIPIGFDVYYTDWFPVFTLVLKNNMYIFTKLKYNAVQELLVPQPIKYHQLSLKQIHFSFGFEQQEQYPIIC